MRVPLATDPAATSDLGDGLGARRVEADAQGGLPVDVLELPPALSDERFESAVRARAAQLAEARIDGLAQVRRVERSEGALRVVADHVEGLRLPDFLLASVKADAPLSQPAALELVGRLARIVAQLHRIPGLAHGAITPAHVVITPAGAVVLTDAVFGRALEGLQRNREQLWRDFGIALPASANLPRFDQRADVSQLGATALAVVLGRMLRADEYPRAANEVVIAATLAARPGDTGTAASALRSWLQECLCLHARATFASALDAERSFATALGPQSAKRGGGAALEAAARSLVGDPVKGGDDPDGPSAWPSPNLVYHGGVPTIPTRVPFVPPPPRETPTRQLGSLFRSVLPSFRAT